MDHICTYRSLNVRTNSSHSFESNGIPSRLNSTCILVNASVAFISISFRNSLIDLLNSILAASKNHPIQNSGRIEENIYFIHFTGEFASERIVSLFVVKCQMKCQMFFERFLDKFLFII